MPGAFDHVLLTRFSAVTHPEAPPMPEEWLRYRLGFFYDACYPSVTRQQAAEFSWLVLFDDRCSDAFRADIEDLAEGAFTPLWTHEPFRRDSFAGPVAERATAPHLITTRIDSDDAIAVDFMASVQAQFDSQVRLFVNFTRGVQIDRTGAVCRSDILASPFLSLIERREAERPPDTVYVTKHARARASGPVLEVRAPVMWAQVVHGVNLSNIVNGPRIGPAVIADRFDFTLGYDDRIAGGRLLAARAKQRGRLTRLWTKHPGELTKYAEARVARSRGTRQWPQDDGSTWTDRVQTSENRVRATWHASGARQRLRAALQSGRQTRWDLTARANRWGSADLSVVTGDPESLLGGSRIAVLAEYDRASRVRPNATALAEALASAGYPTIVVCAREPWVRLTPPVVHERVAVVRRPNLGYDFGSWAAVLSAYPAVARAAHVVLTNDSLLGPFSPIDGLLTTAETAGTDIWAATSSELPRPHVQSYFLTFHEGVLARPALKNFFAGVTHQHSKKAVVQAYEMGLSQLLRDEKLTTAAGWTAQDLGLPPAANPTFHGWRQLLDAGFPFVKRVLVEERHLEQLGAEVRDLLRHRFGVGPETVR
ncbi:MAG: glycosyltransferase [Nostocoides sp.]